MEKKKRGGIVGAVAVAGAALLLAGGGGFGNGAGFGLGETVPAVSDQVVEQAEETVEKEEAQQTEAVTVIEVKQDEYIIDGKTVGLDEIDALIHQVDMYNASFTLVDNYASAKAWDDVMALLVNHGISVVEK